MIETLVIFIVALAVLMKSSHLVLRSSIKIAEYLGIAELVVGYVFIAFFTSLPDFTVSTISASVGHGGIALGDVFGSTIANVCLVLGIAALLSGIYIKREQTLESAEILLIISIVPLLMLYKGVIGRNEGILLLLIFIAYLVFIAKMKFSLNLKDGVSRREWVKNVGQFISGIVLLLISAKFVVASTIDLAAFLNLSDAFIGMTAIAFGTTLPELAIDFIAIRYGHLALAVGDILGSSVINLTLVLGSAAVISPLKDGVLFTPAIAFLVGTIMFLQYNLIKHEGISRRAGLVFVIAYIAFIISEMIVGLGG
ncbi:sodium:calcium antiporter [Candidatus Micrarchaeota archaeon]|nr:sodium:calcium antiporter [Candidatus Micrarchaeota archaeon]